MAPLASQEWLETHLSSVGTLIRGVTYGKGDVGAATDTTCIPILRATNIQDGKLNTTDELVYVRRNKVNQSQLLKAGDIVIAMSSGSKSVVGKAGQLQGEWVGSFGAFCGAFRPGPSVEAQYISYIFQTQAFRARTKGLRVGRTSIISLRNTLKDTPSSFHLSQNSGQSAESYEPSKRHEKHGRKNWNSNASEKLP